MFPLPLTVLGFSLFVAFLYQPLNSENDLVSKKQGGILLLTAHPDDEAMFFAPTLIALTAQTSTESQSILLAEEGSSQQVFSALSGQANHSKVFSLCLSTGDADGQGAVRPDELNHSLDILGVHESNRWIVDHPRLQDNFTVVWDAATIAAVIKPYVLEHGISAILTFDYEGVSRHPNHRALPAGAKELLSNLNEDVRPRLFALVTVPTLGKYTSVWAPIMAKFDLYSSIALQRFEYFIVKLLERYTFIPQNDAPFQPQSMMPVFVAGIPQYRQGFRAMLAHKSQLVWFRWLYLAFSRYMWINEWMEIKV